MNASAASVRNMVKKIISQEVPGKPLSDEAISRIISKQGIDLARRTVAKYREMLNIPSSSQRRMQARLNQYAIEIYKKHKRNLQETYKKSPPKREPPF